MNVEEEAYLYMHQSRTHDMGTENTKQQWEVENNSQVITSRHYMDFFEAKNETLLSYTNEFCESMHSQIRLFEESHRHLNNKKGSESHAKMQHKSCVHINSINLGDV